MKLNRYLVLDTVDHGIKIQIISGFKIDSIEQTFNVQSRWTPGTNEKLFFVSGCKVPRFKLKDKFKCTNKVSSADTVFISNNEINSSSIIQANKTYSLDKVYDGDKIYIEHVKAFLKIAEPNAYVLFCSVVDKFDDVYFTEKLRCECYTNFGYNSHDINWNSCLSASSWGFKHSRQLNTDAHSLYVVPKDSDLHNTNANFYWESEIQSILNDGGIVVNYEKYKELQAMAKADDESLILAMEIMANSDFDTSLCFNLFLLKEFGERMKTLKEYDHVNFKSLINYLDLQCDIASLTIHTMSALLKQHCQFTRRNVQMLSQLCVNDYINYSGSIYQTGPVLKIEEKDFDND